MPGKVVIFDPVVTNRVVLKAQLSSEFFDVTLVSNDADLVRAVLHDVPDAVLMSYSAARTAGFEPLHAARRGSVRGHIPVVFMHDGDSADVWDDCHAMVADDVLSYAAPVWQKAARLNLLIRGKERLDSLRARQSTISDLGFAEGPVMYPPQVPIGLKIDLGTSAVQEQVDALTSRMSRDFPMLFLGDKPQRRADIVVLDETCDGSEALRRLASCRRQITGAGIGPDPDRASLLFLSNGSEASVRKAIELGADDVSSGPVGTAELAVRITRLAWLRQVRQQAERALENHLSSALRDELTGLFNRRYSQKYLSRLLQGADKPQSVTAMMIDIDHFKIINDTHGHLAGDVVLKEVAHRLSRSLRAADLVSRIGGEEFLILLKDLPMPRVRRIAERIREEVSTAAIELPDGPAIAVSVSIGVSRWTPEVQNQAPDRLIADADQALYQAKDDGRNRVTFSPKAA